MLKEIKRKKNTSRLTMREVFVNEEGAIDLASIMVGIIVIGIIGGIIAATILAVIPWTQNNAAKAQLDQVRQAENVYAGLHADGQIVAAAKDGVSTLAFANPFANAVNNLTSVTAADTTKPVYGDLAALKTNKLIDVTKTKIALGSQNNCYAATVVSDSGDIFWTDSNSSDIKNYAKQPTSDCADLTTLVPSDALPQNVASFTFNCPAATTIYAPVSGYTGTVNWGDGSQESYTNATNTAIKHTVKAGENYTVKLTGTFPSLTSKNIPTTSSACLRSMDSWGSGTNTTSLVSAFENATNLVSVPETIPAGVTNFEHAFYNAKAFNQNINNWDVSKSTSFYDTFGYASAFNQPLDKWDVSKANTLSGMFYYASSFNQNVDNWNLQNVTNLNYTFWGAKAYNQPVNDWKVDKVTTMSYLFSESKFNQPVDKWNVSKVQNFDAVFNATPFNQDVSNWNVSSGITFNSTFQSTPFNKPLNTWDVSNAQQMTQMFNGATKFNQPLNSWNVSKVESFRSMFDGDGVFNQPLDNWNTGNSADFSGMFRDAVSFDQNINNWNMSNATNLYGMFNHAIVYNQPMDKWNTSNVTNISWMFAEAYAFNQNINNWDVSNVGTGWDGQSMGYTFYNAQAFNQPLDNWNVSNVADMSNMFSTAYAFNQDISGWNVSNVTNMYGMFYTNWGFNQDLSSWNVGNVTSHDDFNAYYYGGTETVMPTEYQPHWADVN